MKKILLTSLLVIGANALDLTMGTAIGIIKDATSENKKEPANQTEENKIAPWKRTPKESKPIEVDCEYEKRLPIWKRSEECKENKNLGDKK